MAMEKDLNNKIFDEKVKELMKIAEQGDADSQFELARCFNLGNGVQENEAEALKWF